MATFENSTGREPEASESPAGQAGQRTEVTTFSPKINPVVQHIRDWHFYSTHWNRMLWWYIL